MIQAAFLYMMGVSALLFVLSPFKKLRIPDWLPWLAYSVSIGLIFLMFLEMR